MSNTGSSSSRSEEVRRGLEGVVASESQISKVDGIKCELIYRGYHIDELAGNASYEEVSYLLCYGTLPTRDELNAWTDEITANRTLEPYVRELVDSFPRNVQPMSALRSAISILGIHDSEAENESSEAVRRKAVRAIAKTPEIVAAIARHRAGQESVEPKPGLGSAASFLQMLHAKTPTDEQVRALNTYFVLLAEHGFNASTFAARVVTGTRSDFYSAIVAAIGALKGPLHGAANRRAMEELIKIGSPDKVEDYVKDTIASHKRFMGFGHRVYKGEDPRAKHLKRFARTLGEHTGELKWVTIAERLQEAVLKAKQIAVNVDFYSAPLLHYLGIPTEMFTTMFACSRTAGWSANIIEQWNDNRLIRPLALYTGPRGLKFVPVDDRK